MAEPALAGSKSLTREQRDYQFRRIVAHLSEAEAWPKIFDLLEGKPFLADQADFLGGFEVTGGDIERHALAASIQVGDWDRFLRYGCMALSLRGLAEGLAEPEILRALVKGQRLSLARDAVDRLAEPLRRAEARAVLADACGSAHDTFPELLRGIEEDLEAAAPPSAVLSMIARCLGPELSSRWHEWVGRLANGSGAVWAAVAESWLDRGETGSPALWKAFAEIDDPQRLLGLISRLGEIDQGEITERLERIQPLFAEDTIRQLALASFLGCQSRCRPEPAVAAWTLWTTGEPVAWTAELVEACREVIQRLEPDRIETFCSALEAPEAVAAVRVADLEAHPDDRRTAAALQAVRRITDGPVKLHWSLRYLEARPCEPAGEVRGQVGAVAAYLHEMRYEAAAGDLRRFLDLVERFFPNEAKRMIENIVSSPASRPETLLTLARETNRERVAELLLESAERFASSVSLNEAEGFRLRGELIQQAGCRMCLLRLDLKGLEIATSLLLEDEEDELRKMLAPVLAETGLRKQALEVADGIQNARSQFLTRLRVLPSIGIPSDLLASRSLYKAMASAQPLEEERLALSALLANPFDPRELAQRYISPIRSGDLQVQALLRLTRHALAFQRSFYGRRQDRAAVLEVVRGSIAIETDEKLAEWTPEIAVLGAAAGSRAAVDEFQEAARRLAELDTVPWPSRAEALEHLFSQIAPCLLSQGESSRRIARRAVALLASIARLPLGPRDKPALRELRHHWHEVLPMLVTVANRLLKPEDQSLDAALRDGISACRGVENEDAEKIFSLCLAPAPRRLDLALRTLADGPRPSLRQAQAYLLGGLAPERLPDLVRPLPPIVRDPLIVRLIRFGWIAPEHAGPLVNLVSDSPLRREAALWTHLDGSDWLEDLAMLALLRRVSPSQPGFGKILDRLWAGDMDQSRPALARAFVDALRAGGRERGEAALQLWLHVHLAPSFGTERPDALRRTESMREALKRSLVLSP